MHSKCPGSNNSSASAPTPVSPSHPPPEPPFLSKYLPQYSKDGLERFFRFFQSLTQILSSYPILITILSTQLFPLNFYSSDFPPPQPSPPHILLTKPALISLKSKLGLGRRFFRIFRFLEAFEGAYQTYSLTPDNNPEKWLDLAAKGFNGMYLLLESITLLDDLQVIQGGGIWGMKKAKELNVEGQRFWFFSLCCAIALGVLRLGMLRMEDLKGGKKEGEDVQRKRIIENEKKKEKLRRRLIADLMDLGGPGKIVGWVPVDDGVVGLLMLGSTWLTGLEIWERCGREVVADAAPPAPAPAE
ncbi:peroxisomal biogenesis factor 11 [Podospora fimiseda]|uniref:Peroxisomal biogenesis factor 11 n=1 Tax=Podospora fimiseda TaxID=252190 RepID=A0AAN7H2K7_9PEZI|nr:peroxisomal biogenesis factor 11 [Podospora fimiseda]